MYEAKKIKRIILSTLFMFGFKERERKAIYGSEEGACGERADIICFWEGA